MPEHEEEPPSVSQPRVSTGSGPLDQMLSGGLVPLRPYLIVGPSGTGKTTLALQFLCEGVRHGEQCLVVTLEEPPNEIRANHRSLAPGLDEVFVFDAIPDVMRYERAPFKDISSVRQSVRFKDVPFDIRRSPELSSIEVTFTALEQTLKMEMARRKYTRMVIDSLTALQYFCMKGFDETLGAQTFLRFLSDLHVTTLLTVEAPLEDVESPERLLARGEVRLFRWELDGRTVRAIGVEKFRGSPHDNTLHPYRIAPHGLDINLAVTISRDTRKLLPSDADAIEPPAPAQSIEEFATSLALLEQDCRDLAEISADVAPVRAALLEALVAARAGDVAEVARSVVRARGRVIEAADGLPTAEEARSDSPPLRRLRARASAARAGIPPFTAPDPIAVQPEIEGILRVLEPAPTPASPIIPPPAEPESPLRAPRAPVIVPAPPLDSEVPPPPPAAPTDPALPLSIATPKVPPPPLVAEPQEKVVPVPERPRPHVPFPPSAPRDRPPTPRAIPPAARPVPVRPSADDGPPPLPSLLPGSVPPLPDRPPTHATPPPPRQPASSPPARKAPPPPTPPPLPPLPAHVDVAPRSVAPLVPPPEPAALVDLPLGEQSASGSRDLPGKTRRRSPSPTPAKKRTPKRAKPAPEPVEEPGGTPPVLPGLPAESGGASPAPLAHSAEIPPDVPTDTPAATPSEVAPPPPKKRRAPRRKTTPTPAVPAAPPDPASIAARESDAAPAVVGTPPKEE
jgi:KaiC/GvpD/RAD55 family RecA-like ATPase